MARPVALTPMRAAAARQMRRTAADLDRDHPETVAGDHVRDAARVLEHGSADGAKRHLDAAMEVLTPRNLMRHGILDDEGHATAKQHMHAVNRHRLHVQDIEDAQGRNSRLREAAAAKAAPPGSVTRSGGASDGPQQAPAPTPAPAPPAPPQRRAGPKPGQPDVTGQKPDPGPIPSSKMRAAEARLSNAVELKAAWMTERRDTGGRWAGGGGGLAEVLRGQGGKGRAAPYVSPGQASFNRVIFGKKISKGEAGSFAQMLGGGVKIKSVKEDRATLTKSQRAVYDKLRKRGRGHGQAMLVAQRFSPQMLKAAAFASDAAALLLAWDPSEPRGAHGEWIKSSDRANRVLHGQVVTGRTRDGSQVRGFYHHDLGTIRPMPSGRPVKVTHVFNPEPAQARFEAAQRKRARGHVSLLDRFSSAIMGGAPVQAAGDSPAIELFNPGQPRGAHGRWAHTGAPSVSIARIAGVHGAGSFHHARFMDRYADTQLHHPDSKRLLKMATRAMVRRDFPVALRHIGGARWHDANFEQGAHLADLDEMARGVREAASRPPLGGRLYPRAATSSITPGAQHPGQYRPSKGNLVGYANPMIDMSARTATYPVSTCSRPATTPATSGSATVADRRAIMLARIAAAVPGTGHSSMAGTAKTRRTTNLAAFPATTSTMARGTGRASVTATLGSLSPRSSTSGAGAGSAVRPHSHGSTASTFRRSTASGQGLAGPGSLELSARTAALERTPAPRGRPGGPGLYDVRGMGHTAYYQQIVKALIEKRGMPPGKAYAIARGAIRRWARGGGHVHPEVRAAAGRAEAGELQRQARAKSHAVSAWEVADTLIELACEPVELFNPYHAPPGSPAGGQFTTQQQSGQARQKQEAGKDKAQKRALLKKIAGIRAQIAALQAMLPKPRGAKKAKGATRAQTPQQAAAAARRAAAAKSAGSTPRRKGAGAKRMSPATIHAKIAALQATLKADLAQLRSL